MEDNTCPICEQPFDLDCQRCRAIVGCSRHGCPGCEMNSRVLPGLISMYNEYAERLRLCPVDRFPEKELARLGKYIVKP